MVDKIIGEQGGRGGDGYEALFEARRIVQSIAQFTKHCTKHCIFYEILYKKRATKKITRESYEDHLKKLLYQIVKISLFDMKLLRSILRSKIRALTRYSCTSILLIDETYSLVCFDDRQAFDCSRILIRVSTVESIADSSRC